MGDESSKIDEFLQKLKITKYRDKFIGGGVLHVERIADFNRFLQEPNVLKEAGFTVFELNRFKRLCEETIKEIMPKPIPTQRTTSASNEFIPSSREGAAAMVISNIPILKLNCKCLNQEGIVRNKVYPIEVNQSIKYYEFVRHIYQVLSKEVKGVSFNSVELYSQTGYPLAPTPIIYLQPLSNWGLQDNELVYAYPKRLFKEDELKRDVDCEDFIVTIQLKNGSLRKKFKFNKKFVFCLDLKTLLSIELQIVIGCIQIHYFNFSNKTEEIASDNIGFQKKSIEKRNLSFTISDSYNLNNEPFSAFSTYYTSCHQSSIMSEPDFHMLNAYLLYLVREQAENKEKDRLLRRLGLLRNISCSPPLVYALYLLFTDSPTSLPHRVAINEGIITTIALLSSSSDPPNISKFPQLWLHLEEHSLKPDLQLTEIYETTFISKRTRENPRDDETRRLLQAFPPNQDTIITWRNVPSAHDAFSYSPPTRLEDFTHGVNLRFPLQHPVELYRRFIEQRKSYGLMLPLVRGLSSPCVFLGRTEGKYGYFNYFSPEDGKCYSYSPHDIIISERLEIANMNSYPKILIILDISTDMNLAFLEYYRFHNEPNLVLSQLGAAIMLIETLVDSLIGSQCKYLLGALVMSNNHEIPNGFHEIMKPTFEYCVVLENIKKYTEKFKPSPHTKQRINNGIIINGLQYCIDSYSSPSKALKTEIFLFTNSETSKKYYGAKKNSCGQRLYHSSCVVNNIIISHQFAFDIEKLSKLTKGIHLTFYILSKYMSSENTVNLKSHPILQYSSFLQDMLSGASVDTDYSDSYRLLTSKLATKLISTEEFLEVSERDKEEYQKSMLSQGTISHCIHILRNITAYTKSPNPYCKLYPFRNEILKWIVFIQGPIHSPFEGSIFLMELCFGECFPFYPPKLRFLSPVYHPNVDKAGHVCHPILIEDYSPTVTLRQILDAIHSMLSQPIISHAVRCKVLEISIWHFSSYNEIVNGSCTIMGLKGKSLFKIEQDFKINSGSSCTSHPPALVCPITNQLFDNPVMTPEGNTFERYAILQHIEKEETDPISNTPLLSSDLIPNHAIADAVLMYKRKLFARNYWWEK